MDGGDFTIRHRPWYCPGCGAVLPDGDDYARPLYEGESEDNRYDIYCPTCGWSGDIWPDADKRYESWEQSQKGESDIGAKSRGLEELRLAGWRVPVNGENDAPKFPYVHSPLYGEIPAPLSLDMLLRYVESVRWTRPWLRGWRGQANIGWKLESTAARRLESQRDIYGDLPNRPLKDGESFESEMRDYETRLLNQARMAGHGIHRGRELTDLELLSVLQHYGAATRLLDFTRNMMVALWFACTDQAHHDQHGLLVGLESNDARHLQSEADLKAPIPRLIDDLKPDEQYYFWEPRHLFERMRVQQSLFVFGPTIQWPWGSAPFGLYATGSDATERVYREGGNPMLIAIPPSFKNQMIEFGADDSGWRNLFGYDGRSLFPDIEGFSRYHGATRRLESEFFIV